MDFEGDEFVRKVAKSVDEAKTLVEGGFDFVLRGEIREEAHRSFWRDFLVKLLLFVMGVIVTPLLKSVF